VLNCFACHSRLAAIGALCGQCQSALVSEGMEEYGTILGLLQEGEGAWLADRWGRLFALGSGAVIGRAVGDILIRLNSVSKQHARIERRADGWWVVDLESRNGVMVNGEPIDGERALAPRDRIQVGPAIFLFVQGVPSPDQLAFGEQSTVSLGALQRPPLGDELHLLQVSGGGVLRVGGVELPLTLLQYELIHLLLEKLEQDTRQRSPVRGYVPSAVLLTSLSWDTPTPGATNLKQMVRRLRSRLDRAGLRIEGSQGLGYRLWRRGWSSGDVPLKRY